MPITPLETDLLLVIDVQYDFCPGGGLAVADGDAVVPEVNRIARDFAHVLITQDWHPAGHSSFASSHEGAAPFSQFSMPYGAQTLWPDHCVQGTRGAELHDGLELPQAEMMIRKGYRTEIDSYSAFFENDQKTPTGLAGYLRERGFQRVFCVGLATDFCVRFSAVDARKQGFEATVIESACRAIDLEGSLAAAKSEMTGLGVELLESW
ncbi:bifunctional nicotinamidase/pyrazinamidase [Pelagibius sp. Alg239-R121]|uniref:bifunctional nicotinamidase/pyrazinamidase n=1 Tax=Pelagibius sp. Alg239-R121 TaxID=2993448 RepID=UPI0024A71366|nr:bifunctional nicotinamidase/pyrazinamidase [Pelagibius sp. Alg239-R121]